jgi:hypothetical protein
VNIPDERRVCYLRYRHALKHGVLVRKPCCMCGDPKTEGHHENHSKPLDVVWLCRSHHGYVGWLGRKHKAESREKIRLANMGNKGRKGQPLTLEHRQKIAAWHRGKKSPETSERNRNRVWTDEMRHNASEAAKRRRSA